MTKRSLREALKAPDVAWPTILVCLLASTSWITVSTAAALGLLPLWSACTIAAIAGFFAFTPAHDAAHGSVSRFLPLNAIVGRISSLQLGAPFAAFRHMHLDHHRYTNDPARDPDHYSGRGNPLLLPMRWMSQDLYYYLLLARCWRSRPTKELVEIAGVVAAQGAIMIVMTAAGLGWVALFCWIVPARIAVTLLAFSFDYLPHAPHRIPASVDRFRATHILLAPGLTLLFLYQNYHLIHHLYPGIPFYRYRAVFDHKETELASRGARICSIKLFPNGR